MKFDVFFSISHTPVDGYLPTERVMWENFFDQVSLADDLGFETAWVAETHLSCQIQKQSSQPVIPHFEGEIGLNTDILQVAHLIFSKTKKIQVGSAIRNILCNGGPVAHAEAIRTFLSLHGIDRNERRKLNIGFAAGRFDFSNRPYGIVARNAIEKAAWPVVKGKAFLEAVEIFMRLLKGEQIARTDVPIQNMRAKDFRTPEEWSRVREMAKKDGLLKGSGADELIEILPFYNFEKVGVIPFEAPMNLLNLTIGSHDAESQALANRYLPTGVFNLSITPPAVIEETHKRMASAYHRDGGSWRRDLMPRTAMIFLDTTQGLSSEARTEKAKKTASKAWEIYWKAMEGTIDSRKVEQAVGNTLAGSPEVLAEQIRAKYHPDDRLMLWFDFNNHDNNDVKRAMRDFKEQVIPLLRNV